MSGIVKWALRLPDSSVVRQGEFEVTAPAYGGAWLPHLILAPAAFHKLIVCIIAQFFHKQTFQTAFCAASEDGDEEERAEKTLAKIAEWIHTRL